MQYTINTIATTMTSSADIKKMLYGVQTCDCVTSCIGADEGVVRLKLKWVGNAVVGRAANSASDIARSFMPYTMVRKSAMTDITILTMANGDWTKSGSAKKVLSAEESKSRRLWLKYSAMDLQTVFREMDKFTDFESCNFVLSAVAMLSE